MVAISATASVESTISRPGLVLSDYLQRLFAGESFEIVAGKVIPMGPTIAGHSFLANFLADLFKRYAAEHTLGIVFVEMTYTTAPPADPNWVKGSLTPDVMFIDGARFITYEQQNSNWKTEPLRLIPDLAVEILSPNDSYPQVLIKAAQYLSDGVRVVWLINFEREIVTVCASNEPPQSFSGAQQLTADPVLPGWSITVADLFSAS